MLHVGLNQHILLSKVFLDSELNLQIVVLD